VSKLGLKEGEMLESKLKKYSVFVLMKGGQSFKFETNTNLKMVMPVNINGANMLITEEYDCINVDHIEVMNIEKIN